MGDGPEIPKVGGTKDVQLDRVRELRPTHVVVNVDENLQGERRRARRVRPPRGRHPPAAPRDNLDLYRLLGAGRSGASAEAEELCARFERAYERAAARAGPEPRDVLYLIWRDPWMSVSPRHLHLPDPRALQLAHPAAAGPCRHPGATTDEGAIRRSIWRDFAGRVDRVLLSSRALTTSRSATWPRSTALVPGAEVSLIDGEMTSWYGSRAIAGLDYLAEFTR